MNVQEYVTYDAIGLAELIAKGDVDAAEVAEAAIDAIQATNPAVNAVVESWEPIVPGNVRKNSPLFGAPILIKDLGVAMAGKKSELGSRLAEGLVMAADSTLMARFKEAGLVTIGRTTTPEFAISTTSEAQVVGPTRNPWNPYYGCGGSSGGSGAAVAAGMVPFAHATDAGGSIRVPAAVNGVFGLKPTRGLVSNGPWLDEVWSGLVSQLGVSRSVRDSAAILDAISLPASGEPYYTRAPEQGFLFAAGMDPRPLRIGLAIDPSNGSKTADGVASALLRLSSVLEGLGHHVELVSFDLGVSWEAFVLANAQLWGVNTAAWIDYISCETRRPITEAFLEPATLNTYRYGKALLGTDVLQALSTRNSVTRRLGEYFQRFDILMNPTLPELPLKIGEYNSVQSMVDGLGWIEHVFAQSPFTALANVAGVPSMSVPYGFDLPTGLPLGALFTARFGEDGVLFSLAGQIERATFARPTPGIWAGGSTAPRI